MAFPYEDSGVPMTQQAVLAGVAGVSAGAGALRVSTITAAGTVTTSPLSADGSSVSAKQGDAANLRISAIQADAGNLMISAKSGDAALLRMSAIGGTAGDNTIVDGTTQSISATLTPISANPATTIAGIVVHANQPDAGRLLISAKSGDAGVFLVSAKQGDGANLRISAVQDSAAALNVSAKSNDGALLRVSAVQDGGTALNVSAKSNDGALLRTSAIQDGAAALNVSAKSGDAGLLLVSAKSGTATQMVVSATQGDGALLRVSALESAVTTSTGGLSLFSTSAGIAQVSTIKSAAGRLYGYHLTHGAGVDQYLVVFNMSGGATLATDVPTLRLGVPAGTGSNTGAGAIGHFSPGIAFATGIQIAVVSGSGGDGSTAGASAMRVNIFYA